MYVYLGLYIIYTLVINLFSTILIIDLGHCLLLITLFDVFSASATTFSRFIPTIKARFDYGALIFILTFSLVSVSGYRVDELFNLAQQRISTIIIGTSLCIIVSTAVLPVWAGLELHVLVTGNLDKLANSLQGQFKDSRFVHLILNNCCFQ